MYKYNSFPASLDLDDATLSGIYTGWASFKHTYNGTWTGIMYMLVIRYTATGDYLKQIHFPDTEEHSYICTRTRFQGVYNSWKTIELN